MKRFYLFFLATILLYGCTGNDGAASALLDEAAKNIESNPKFSLNLLDSIKHNELHNQQLRARYSLLKSMALDKNYIDITSDSLTSAAISYYRSNGTADEKLKVYYYNGIIYLNKNDYEEAMKNFLQAEKYAERCKDYVSVGRLFNSKMMILKNIFNVVEAIKPAKLSAHYYLKGKDTSRFMTAMNNICSMLLSSKKYDSVKVCFEKIKQYEKFLTPKQKSNYYANLINYKIDKSDSTLTESVDEYLKHFRYQEDKVKWHIVAFAHFEVGDLQSALYALEKFEKYSDSKSYNIYHYIASQVYYETGEYEKAYHHIKRYQEVTNKRDYAIFQSDTKFIEERYASQEKHLKQRFYIIILCLSLIIILFITGYIYRYLRDLNEKRLNKIKEMETQRTQLKDEFEKILAEKEKLQSIIENKSTEEWIKQLLEQRLSILNKFIVSNISGVDMRKSITELEQFLSNNNEFLQSTKLAFEITHPNFISYLTNKGLTEWEVGCCCLYCIGLNGNEISNYLNIKYFYKKSSLIRKKLNIQSINIDTYLITKMKELK